MTLFERCVLRLLLQIAWNTRPAGVFYETHKKLEKTIMEALAE